jgi:hypothetical protein
MMSPRRSVPLAALTLGLAVALAARAEKPTAAPPPAAPPALPKDVLGFVSVDVAAVWDHKGFAPVREARGKLEFAWAVQSLVGVTPAELDRLTLFWHPSVPDAPFAVVATRKPLDPAAVVKTLTRPGAATPKAAPGGKVLVAPGAEFAFVVPVDARTVLLGPKSADPAEVAKRVDLLPELTVAAGRHALAVGLDVQAIVGLPLPFGGPLLEARTATLTADLAADRADVRLTATFPTAERATVAAPILRAKFDEIAGWSKEQVRKAEERTPETNSYPAPLLEWVGATLKGAKVRADGPAVVATAEVNVEEAVGRVMMAVPDAALAPRGPSAGQNNLKQIGIALHSYHDVNNHFPTNVYDADGKPLLSWRVQILPYLEQTPLYQQFKMDEPWDSPHNKPLSQSVVNVFQLPGRPAPQPWETYFQTFIAPKDVKPDARPWLVEGEKQGPRITNISDGTSNTLMVVEAAAAVPWAKPVDLPYDGVTPPKLGNPSGTFLALFGDGSTATFRRGQLDTDTLRWMISLADGMPVNIPGR